MKKAKTISTSILAILFFSAFVQTQTRKLPSVDLKTTDGKTVNTSTLSNDGKPIVISFWATWCTPCKKELNEIAEVYTDWQKETGVKLIAVSIDDSKTSVKVKPYVDSKAWEYDIYLDVNSDLKRAMNVVNVPHTFVLNAGGEIVWETNVYTEGGVKKLYEVIQKVAKGEKIEN
jgi:peroxiredoxin